MDFISLVWAFISGIEMLYVFYLWGAIASILLIIWLIQKNWDPEQEIQGPNTYGWEERGTAWNICTRILVTALTFLYLPCMTSAFQVMFCFGDMLEPFEITCYEGKYWGHFFVSLGLFVFIGLFLPYQVYIVINKYQPIPHQYDESGLKIDIAADNGKYLENYRHLLDDDKCPYNFLYCGFEYGWSSYKVISMVIKMLLVFPMIPCTLR